jgi:hypothetical protein
MTEMRKVYDKIDSENSHFPVFYKSWWLDVVTDGNWIPLILENSGNISGCWGLPFRKRKGVKEIRMPQLTPKAGPFLLYPQNQSPQNKLAFEKKNLNALIDQLPDFHWFDLAFDVSLTNWLPFYWKGFKQYTRYTYRFDGISDPDAVIEKFDYSKIKNIKKIKDEIITKKGLDIDIFLSNLESNFEKRGEKLLYSKSFVRKLFNEIKKNKAGEIFYNTDDSGNIHAALLVVWDQITAYALISSINYESGVNGAYTLLISDIIRELSTSHQVFDLEGSMIESVENSFRKLGANQAPFFQISKTNSFLIDLYKYSFRKY